MIWNAESRIEYRSRTVLNVTLLSSKMLHKDLYKFLTFTIKLQNDFRRAPESRVGLGCRYKSDRLLQDSRTMREVPSVEVFLRDPRMHLSEVGQRFMVTLCAMARKGCSF